MTAFKTASCITIVILCAFYGSVFAVPSNVTAFFRDGQTFITWTEDGSATYDIYRHTEAITAGNIAQAVAIATVDSQSSNTKYYVGGNIGQTHWIIEPKTADTGLGAQLTDSQGLFVHTIKEASGNFYYAVCSGGSSAISGNITGPIAEQKMVTQPIPIWRKYDSANNNRLNIHYAQFMDYSIWNAAHEGYIFNFSVSFPPAWDTATAPLGVFLYMYGRSFDGIGWRLPALHAYPLSTNNIRMQVEAVGIPTSGNPSDLQDWYYGYRNKDSSAVYNYTEYRVIKAVLFVCAELKGDQNRVFACGHSMGASGVLSLSERYPSVFSAVYCSQPATDWSNLDFAFNGDARKNYGSLAENLPIYNIPFDDLAHPELDALLQQYNGTPVYEWQNIRQQLMTRAGDDMPLICTTHGRSDIAINWSSQGAPFGPVLRDSRRPFKYIVNDDVHNDQKFNSVNFLQLFGDNVTKSSAPYIFRRNVSMPGFSGINESNTLVNATWTMVADSPSVWSMTIAGVGQTCNITPRRCQMFYANPGDSFDVYVAGTKQQTGVAADSARLVTAMDVDLTTTKTIRIVNTYRNPVTIVKKNQALPRTAAIEAYPNPFNSAVKIAIIQQQAAGSQKMEIAIYNVQGGLVKNLPAASRPLSTGITWDASDQPTGVYVVRARVNNVQLSKKIAFVK